MLDDDDIASSDQETATADNDDFRTPHSSLLWEARPPGVRPGRHVGWFTVACSLRVERTVYTQGADEQVEPLTPSTVDQQAARGAFLTRSLREDRAATRGLGAELVRRARSAEHSFRCGGYGSQHLVLDERTAHVARLFGPYLRSLLVRHQRPYQPCSNVKSFTRKRSFCSRLASS